MLYRVVLIESVSEIVRPLLHTLRFEWPFKLKLSFQLVVVVFQNFAELDLGIVLSIITRALSNYLGGKTVLKNCLP